MSGMSEGALGAVVTAIPVMLVASYFASPGIFIGWALGNQRRRRRDRDAPQKRPIWPDPVLTDQLLAWLLLVATACTVVAELLLLRQIIWASEPFPDWVQSVAFCGSIAAGVLLLMEVVIAPMRLQILERIRERMLVSARENDRTIANIDRSVMFSAEKLDELVRLAYMAPASRRRWWNR